MPIATTKMWQQFGTRRVSSRTDKLRSGWHAIAPIAVEPLKFNSLNLDVVIVRNFALFFLVFFAISLSSQASPLKEQATKEPPSWSGRFAGIAYGPSGTTTLARARGRVPLVRIDSDMRRLSRMTLHLRTYGIAGRGVDIPVIARRYGLMVSVGLWLGRNRAANDAEIARGLKVIIANKDVVDRVFVGNEVMLRHDMTAPQLIAYILRVKQALAGTNIQVSTADTWGFWLKYPELAGACDFIAVHILPYWDSIAVEDAVPYLAARYDEVQRAFPTKKIVIAETGWPSAGKTRGKAVPSLEGEAYFVKHFAELAAARHYDYYMLEAFDQPWKVAAEGGVGGSWGLMDVNRHSKFTLFNLQARAER